MAESLHIDVKQHHHGSDKGHSRASSMDQKVTNLGKIFFVANFILEFPSAAFDQLSSAQKPQYALLSMVMSFLILIISTTDLVYKGQKEGVTWMRRGLFPWFYHPHQNYKPFGTLPDIFGLLCACSQSIFAAITYTLLSQQVDNPVKVSFWPIIFAFCLLFSRLPGNPPQKRSTLLARKLNRVVEFTLAELVAATDDFSFQNKIYVRQSGVCYIGKLADGEEVVVMRGEKGQEAQFSEEQQRAFESELVVVSRLHHKNLIRFIGYYEDEDKKLIVYECINNGNLYEYLHDKNKDEKNGNVINSWKMRIKIALDAARGLEYLHHYAVPPVIHRDVKSLNILLDANWIARVVNFSLSLNASESENGDKSMQAVGTVGYIDPEYYNLNILTAKSDVYSFGVVLLELLTGKRAIFCSDDSEGEPTNLVDFAVPLIMSDEFTKAVDSRVSLLELNEVEAVELVAYTALHCVNLEGRNRPSMTNVVANLEQSLSLMNAS